MTLNNQNMSSKTVFVAGAIGIALVLGIIVLFILWGSGLLGESGGTVKTANNPSSAIQPAGMGGHGAPVAPKGSSNIKLPKFTGDEWYKGGENAKVTIVEFSDTECPFCKKLHSTLDRVVNTYGDKVKWVYRHAPLHSKSQRESEALECAGDLGGNDGFWKYTDRLFEITTSNNGLSDSKLPQIAEYIGLDREKFVSCLDSGKYTSKVKGQLQEAQIAGLRGTPYSVIVFGDQTIPLSGAQPFAQIKTIIDSLL